MGTAPPTTDQCAFKSCLVDGMKKGVISKSMFIRWLIFEFSFKINEGRVFNIYTKTPLIYTRYVRSLSLPRASK